MIDVRGISTTNEPTHLGARQYANITYREVWFHDDDGAQTNTAYPIFEDEGYALPERSYDYFHCRERLQARERLQRSYPVIRPSSRHPSYRGSDWLSNWDTQIRGLKYKPTQVTKATQYDLEDIRDFGPFSRANANIDKRVHQMIYDLKDDYEDPSYRRSKRRCHRWSDAPFMKEADDRWNCMCSQVKVAPDSEAEEADDDAVPYTLYHREKESMEDEYAKKAPDPEAIPSPGAVNAAKAEELDPQ